MGVEVFVPLLQVNGRRASSVLLCAGDDKELIICR